MTLCSRWRWNTCVRSPLPCRSFCSTSCSPLSCAMTAVRVSPPPLCLPAVSSMSPGITASSSCWIWASTVRDLPPHWEPLFSCAFCSPTSSPDTAPSGWCAPLACPDCSGASPLPDSPPSSSMSQWAFSPCSSTVRSCGCSAQTPWRSMASSSMSAPSSSAAVTASDRRPSPSSPRTSAPGSIPASGSSCAWLSPPRSASASPGPRQSGLLPWPL